MASIALSPYITTNNAGSFHTYSDGLIQGMAMPDPAARFALSGGILASTETSPMWGGLPIVESIPAATSAQNTQSLGGSIARATAIAGITGFSVFDQNYAAPTTPQSPVPLVAGNGMVNFYRLGSGARIPVAIDPALVDLDGESILTQVAWDFTNNRLAAYASGDALPVKVLKVYGANCKTVSYDSGTGFATWNSNGAAALILI